MEKGLLVVALRQRALYLPNVSPTVETSPHTLALVAQLKQQGYTVSEPLLHALGGLDEDGRQEVLDAINEVMGTKLNWASLVRGWLTPTGESVYDHFTTYIFNLLRETDRSAFGNMPGTTLPCGHFIPAGTFPLERYTGCPFCGKPLKTAPGQVYTGQGADKLKMLTLWTDEDIDRHERYLLQSPVPLDATQSDSLKTLLASRPLPGDVSIAIKETRILVIDALVDLDRADEAGRLFDSPVDVMRYLWYRHTGHLQIVEPRTLYHSTMKNMRHELTSPGMMLCAEDQLRNKLKLKYSRRWCRQVAQWLNGLTMPIDAQLESMHPKREMWVRFIRALRLSEHARKPGFEQLRTLIDRFYHRDYSVWQGKLDRSLRNYEADSALALLQQRPGVFSRRLFSTMLLFGPDKVLDAFRDDIDRVQPRLLISLETTAETYFDHEARRVARPITGLQKVLPPHSLLTHYTDADLDAMKQKVRRLYLDAMRRRFALDLSGNPQTRTIYIDPKLYHIPVSVGDRSATIQDTSTALQGERFPVSGDAVRLFLQWGVGLPAQPLDMDLSCYILTDSESTVCAYYNLTAPGARHSGDIRHIPDQVGTAEYIELSLNELQAAGARRVVFTCNAYTAGSLQPGLVVGWMSAEAPMNVSEENGVAYDPSTVDHMVRISESNLSKGLIFGVLNVDRREITWLEMPFDGQTIQGISPATIDALLQRLASKPSIGQLLLLKAEVQHMTSVPTPDEADEAYTIGWARDTARVSQLLLD